MRTSILSAAICLSLAGLSTAAEVKAAVRRTTHISAQGLGPALQELAKDHGFQVLYRTEVVGKVRTAGAAGELTAVEALTQLLSGTGLTFVYLDDATITIVPQSASLNTEQPAAVEKSSATRGSSEASAASDGPNVIQEVIVTAQKRSERLEDIPLPIQAVTDEQLYKLGAKNFSDYAGTVAGLTLVDSGPGRSQVFIRGVSAPQGYIGMESAVGVYLDEVPISEGGGQPDMNLYDVNRIEVLRGPQGTLYGSSSLGGTIRIITNRPNLTEVDALVSSELSSAKHGGFNASYNGMLNLPVIDDRLGVRAVLYGRNIEGFIDDPFQRRSNINSEDTWGGRASVRYKPAEQWTVDLTGMYQDSKLDGTNRAEDFARGYEDLKQYQNMATPFTDRSQVYNGTIAFDGQSVSFTSATSFSHREREIQQDLTGLDILGTGALTPTTQDFSVDSFTQEARLASVQTTPVSWIAGLYYNKRDADFFQTIESIGVSALLGLPGDHIAILEERSTVEQTAIFGELGYSPIEQLTLTVGLRAAHIDTSGSALRTGLLFGDGLSNKNDNGEDVYAPKLNVSYKLTPDSLVYAQATKGYRIGGQNVTFQSLGDGFVFPTSYDPDSLWNYEVGYKGSMLDRRLNVSIDLFYIDWQDIQLGLDHQGYEYFTNAGDAISKGMELETRLYLFDDVLVGGQVSYTDATLRTTTPGVGSKGDRVPDVPKVSASGFVETGRRTGLGRLYARVDVSRTGSRYRDFGSVDNQTYGDFTLTNAKVGFDADAWRLALFVRNVFDERGKLGIDNYLAGVIGSPADISSYILTRPRTAGVELTYSF